MNDFIPNRIRLFFASGDDALDPAFGELGIERRHRLVEQPARRLAQRCKFVADGLVGFGVQPAERMLLQLLADLLHADTAGQRGVDVERFLGVALLALGRIVFERAHVVQAVGELDQQHPDVARNRDQQFAEILGLFGLFGHEIEPLDLGQPIDELADLFAEELIDLGARRVRVFDGIVQ